MSSQELSTTEYAVLGLLAEEPSHGFALSKQLDTESEVGRIYTIRRPLVYRALSRLVEAGYAEPVSTEKGRAGPKRVIHRVTRRGRLRLLDWLVEPVEHVRDLRIEFILKLALLQRSGQPPTDLIRDQKRALEPTFQALDDPNVHQTDHVELWRRHIALAAQAYLNDLEDHYTEDSESR